MNTTLSSNLFGPTYVRAIAPYIGGRPITEVAREFNLQPEKIIKLASNENPLGMPTSARIAIQNSLEDIARYPDGNAFELKQALSKKFAVPETWITLGNGSNDILELVARACVAVGQEVIFSEYAFAVYAIVTQAVGGVAKITPAINYGHDLSAMLQAINERTRLIYIANPNNPTGTFCAAEEIQNFLSQVPPHIVVVLDEAYTEYLSATQKYNAIAWVQRFPNLLISRTFSKAYGLAGLRIGFGIAQPELTDLLNRIRQPFNVNSPAQVAAIAALNDDEFIDRSASLNAQGYAQLTTELDALELSYLPSAANFILIKVGNHEHAGLDISNKLLAAGIIVRPVANYGLPQHIRVTIGLPEENAAFIKALQAITDKP
jgi:histidinol-phosphate aminotransferase